MTIPDNREIMEAYRKIEEAEMTGAAKNSGKTGGYGDGASVEVYGGGTVRNDNDQGSNDAPAEFTGKGSVDAPAKNDREAGAINSPDEFEGNNNSANQSSTETRKAGASQAPKEFETVDAFRNRVRQQFGLPLDAKINKGNKGVQR